MPVTQQLIMLLPRQWDGVRKSFFLCHAASMRLTGRLTAILSPIMDYGILKERFAAISTDAIRAKLLEAEGYQTQILEFIDMEHTPKNLLIRAVKTGNADKKALSDAAKMSKELNINLTLMKLLED